MKINIFFLPHPPTSLRLLGSRPVGQSGGRKPGLTHPQLRDEYQATEPSYLYMAELRISCPHCNKEITCDDQWAGQELQCPLCQGAFVMPGAAPAAAAAS